MNIIYDAPPSMDEMQLFSDFSWNKVKEEQRITVTVHQDTKTRLTFTFRYRSQFLSVNIIPPGSEKFKFHADRNWKYFVISKKTTLAVIEEHIRNLVAHKLQLPHDADFEIHIWLTRFLFSLGATQTEQLAKVS